MIIRGCVGLGSSSSTTSSQANVEDNKLNAYIASQGYVEDYLKAPGSAKLPYSGDITVTCSGNKFCVSAYVDAQNSFGALLRDNYYCELLKSGSGEWAFECTKLIIGDEYYIGTPDTTPNNSTSGSTQYTPPQQPYSSDQSYTVPDMPNMPTLDPDEGKPMKKCSACNGSGVCPNCGGGTCRYCNSTGKCIVCKGKGKGKVVDEEAWIKGTRD